MESRRGELAAALERGGVERGEASTEVERAIDRAVYYAGFCDKFQSLVASSNPVAGPHFGFSVPEPMGIVAIVSPPRPALLGLVSTVLPVLAGGNVAVVVAGADDPRVAVVWCECLATSDLPGGVVNLLTGQAAEIAPHLARSTEGRRARRVERRRRAAGLRRARRQRERPSACGPTTCGAAAGALGAEGAEGLAFIERFLETKTVWHPVGL